MLDINTNTNTNTNTNNSSRTSVPKFILRSQHDGSKGRIREWLEQRGEKKTSGLLYGVRCCGKTRAGKEFVSQNPGTTMISCNEHPSFNAVLRSLLLHVNRHLKAEHLNAITIKPLKQMLALAIEENQIEMIVFDDFSRLSENQWLRTVQFLNKHKVGYIAIDSKENISSLRRIRSKVITTFAYRLEMFPEDRPDFDIGLIAPSADISSIKELMRRHEDRVFTEYEYMDVACDRLIDDTSAVDSPIEALLPQGVTRAMAIESLSLSAIELSQAIGWQNPQTSDLDLSRIERAIEGAIALGEVAVIGCFTPLRYITKGKYQLLGYLP